MTEHFDIEKRLFLTNFNTKLLYKYSMERR